MTINYTSLLGLAQPVTGTETNTWGEVVNDEITALIEEAIAGGETIDVTASDVTLTDTDGVSNQARNAVLIITGTPGTPRNIVAPSQSKVYVVINGSNAAVVVKGSATTGVTIAASARSIVAWNGSDFVEVATPNNGDVVGPASSTDNAIARFDGTTGKSVKNTGVTIDDSNNVAGIAVATVAAGTASAPSITTTGDTDTGIFFPAADTIAFTEGGVEAMRIDSSGNVGIGTSSPGSLLDVNGTVTGGKFVPTANTTAGNGMYLPTTNTLAWSTDGTERMRIDSAGNVGIGTSSPTNKLTVDGNANITGNLVVSGSATITSGSVTNVTLSSSNATITGGSVTGITDLAIADGGTGASTADNALTNLGGTTVGTSVFKAASVNAAQQALDLEVGVDVQAYDANIAKYNDVNPSFTDTGAIKVPTGTEIQRPGTPATGQLRFNSDAGSFEGYDGTAWGAIGGGGGGEAGGAILINKDTATENYTIATGENGFSVGPMTVADGVTITVSDGQRWVVI